MKNALILTTSVTLSMSIAWFTTLYYYRGRADMNYFGEGWFEFILFLSIGLYGLYELRKT